MERGEDFWLGQGVGSLNIQGYLYFSTRGFRARNFGVGGEKSGKLE